MSTAAWYVPELVSGSGGLRTVFAMADALQRSGIKTKIYLENSVRNPRRDVRSRFGYDFEHVQAGWRADSEADLAVATVWYSAPFVANLGCRHKFYFVQDYEAYFRPVGDTYLMAENTYRLDLNIITMGRWLAHRIHESCGRVCYPLEFGADDRVYTADAARADGAKDEKRSSNKLTLCFINQPEKPRRCSRLGQEAIALFKQKHPQVEVRLFGSTRGLHQDLLPALRLKHRNSDLHNHGFHNHGWHNLGLLKVADCADLYRQSTVGLCISATNPSRVPFEMMACGLPVVDVHRENNLFDFEDGTVTLAQQTPAAIAEALSKLIRDPQLRARRAQASAQFMQGRNHLYEAEQFTGIINKVLSGELSGGGRAEKAGKIEPWYKEPPVTASAAVASNTDGIDGLSGIGGLQRQGSLRRWYFRLMRLLPGPLAAALDRRLRAAAGHFKP